MERVSRQRSFGGYQDVYSHHSETLDCPMRVGVYLPPATNGQAFPVLYFLSGLTCSEQNVITKAGAQRFCAQHGLILVCPDTSPRGDGVADDPAIDLGQGAGFYLNSTESPWAAHFQMYDYVTSELPRLVAGQLPSNGRAGITGHSMGGHGALICALRNPDQYESVSAFSPIVTPSQVPWGIKAFTAYLGPDQEGWKQYDATQLVRAGAKCPPILIDQGGEDQFLKIQLQPDVFENACSQAGQPCDLRRQAGYDHSYYFIASFIGDHIEHHAGALLA